MPQLLLIEDDPVIRSRLIGALRERGYVVASADKGMTGLGLAVEDRPDLVLLDLGLPDIDGTEVLRMLRAVSAVPVIITSARDDEWREFTSDGGRYLAEIAKEHRIEKYTLAELEEEEQSLDRLRRWYRDIRARDLLGSSHREKADALLKQCVAAFDEFAEAVYARMGQS